jgi:hypothetical protein
MSLSAEELRAHFRPRTTSNYLTLAISQARTHAAHLAAETHWIDYDAPVTRGHAQAACGSIVDAARFSQAPTCLACRQQQALVDAFRF